jgi:hypothetical protein
MIQLILIDVLIIMAFIGKIWNLMGKNKVIPTCGFIYGSMYNWNHNSAQVWTDDRIIDFTDIVRDPLTSITNRLSVGALYGLSGLAIEQAIITPIRPVYPILLGTFFAKHFLEQYYFSPEFVQSYKNWKGYVNNKTEEEMEKIAADKIINEHLDWENKRKQWAKEREFKEKTLADYKTKIKNDKQTNEGYTKKPSVWSR